MSGMTFAQMRARVEAEYGRDPEDSDNDDDSFGQQPTDRRKRRAKPSIYADNERPPPEDDDGAWNDVLCDILAANTRDTEDERLVNIVRNDKAAHAAEWSTLDRVRVPTPKPNPQPNPKPNHQSLFSAAKPANKTLYDDLLEEYADVVTPQQRSMFRSAMAPDEPDVPETHERDMEAAKAPYSIETETPPIASLLAFIKDKIMTLVTAERAAILRAILRHQQRLLLTERADLTRRRTALAIFERTVKPRLGGRYKMDEWRRDLVGKWAGAEMFVSASNEHVLLDKHIEGALLTGRVYVDIYHLEDAIFVYCIYSCAAVTAISTGRAATVTAESRDPADYAAFKGLRDTRPFVFEGYLVTQSLQSHEQDVNAAELYKEPKK